MNLMPLPRGKQRRAVYDALQVPRTAKQVLYQARKAAPRITLQDIRPILRSYEDERRIRRLNPQSGTGVLYCRCECLQSCLLRSDELDLYSQVARAMHRQAVLCHIGKPRWETDPELTATQIKKELREQQPMGLNHVIRALGFLRRHALVAQTGTTDIRSMAIYSTTSQGDRFCQQFALAETDDSKSPEGDPHTR